MTSELIILCLAAFAGGFVDSIAGGGGLIQTPVTLVTLPQYPLAKILGTIKIPSILGASIAATQYALKVSIRWRLLAVMCSIAGIAAYCGSRLVAHTSNAFMKPIMFGMLIIVAIYTYAKKDFGTKETKNLAKRKEFIYGACFALVIGFYDGFIGPGSGSFMVLFFISIIGFDFLEASAHAKMVNVSTNLGSIIFFAPTGNIMYHFAIPMAIANFTGALLGARLAILKGNKFIRIFFLIVITGTIIRFGYDIFFR